MSEPEKKKKHYGFMNPKYAEIDIDSIIPMYAEGMADIEVIVALGISKETFYNWLKDENKKEFHEAVKIGRAASESWWTKLGRRACDGEVKSDSKIYALHMRNRFQWEGGTGRAGQHREASQEDDVVKRALHLALDKYERDY